VTRLDSGWAKDAEGMPPEKEACLTEDEVARLLEFGSECAVTAGEIARAGLRFAKPIGVCNADIGIIAVKDGLSATQAPVFRDWEGLRRFVDLHSQFREGFFCRIAGIHKPREEDIDAVFVATRLDVDDYLLQPMQDKAIQEAVVSIHYRLIGRALHELHHMQCGAMCRLLHFLHLRRLDDPPRANDDQIRKAHADALHWHWQRTHRVAHWGLLFLQIAAAVLLATYTQVQDPYSHCMLGAGILATVVTLLVFGTRA